MNPELYLKFLNEIEKKNALSNIFHDFLLYKAGFTVKITQFCNLGRLRDINLAVTYILTKCLLHMLSEKVTGLVTFQSVLIVH